MTEPAPIDNLLLETLNRFVTGGFNPGHDWQLRLRDLIECDADAALDARTELDMANAEVEHLNRVIDRVRAALEVP